MLTDRQTGYPSKDLPQSIDASFFEKNPIIPSLDIITLLKLLSRKTRNNPAIDCNDLKATYQELIDDSHLIYLALKKLGIKKGNIVCISLPSNYQALISFFALNELGAVTTFLDCYASEEEVISYLEKYNAPLFICYGGSKLDCEIIKQKSVVENIVILDEDKVDSRDFKSVTYNKDDLNRKINFHELGNIATGVKTGIHLPNSKKSNALILYTSGSTGEPKAVVLTNENIIAAQMYAGNTSHTENITGTKTMTCVPLRYPYGMVTSLLTSLLWGKEAIMTPDWDSNKVNYYYQKKPNIVFGSPAVLDVTMRFLDDGIDLAQISHFISGGDFMTVSHAELGYQFFEKHGAINIEIGNGCGNAETVSIGSTPVGVPLKQHTAGKILVGSTPMIIDPNIPDNKPIDKTTAISERSYGEVGELCLSGKYIFKEYFGEMYKTECAKFKRNGKTFFRTGTLGYIDKEGYFIPTDRKSRFYIRSTGHKVYMDNVQHIIASYPGIVDCAVVKKPDKEELYVSKAFIIMDKTVEKGLEECKVYVYEQLKHATKLNGKEVKLKEYEIPRFIEFVDQLPLLKGTEKIDYKTLEEMG